jgi:regulation of enolase protein 1 (concanavalin A-like superfamily)
MSNPRRHLRVRIWLGMAVLTLVTDVVAQTVFEDSFQGKLTPGWSWVREHREAWRLTAHGLEVRLEPGNMWGPANDARNLLIRAAPDPAKGQVEVAVTVEHYPTNQYEQVDLAWYFNDSNMVKLGEELVDGKLSIVMGREEQDKTRTVAIIPLESNRVRLHLLVQGNRIRGQFQPAGATDWREVGACDLPAAGGAEPKVSLQFYQGTAEAEHWAKVSSFQVRQSVAEGGTSPK